MISMVLFGLLLLSQLVVSQVRIIDSPSDVTTCLGGEARFSCFVWFTSGTPSGASWIQDSGTNVSTLPNHMLFDNSSSSSSLPAIVNNTLLITNISLAVGYGHTYFCQQGDVMSDMASLTTFGLPTGTIVPGVPSPGSGSPDSITLSLSYGNANSQDEIITGISLSWRDNGNSMGSVMLNSSANSYTITGLTPSTEYIITLVAINQCGNGEENVVRVPTTDGSRPTNGPTGTDDTTGTTNGSSGTNGPTGNNNQTATTNPTDSPGAAAGMKCNTMALFCLIAAVVVVMI